MHRTWHVSRAGLVRELCDALPRPVHQQRPKPSTAALYHDPKGPVTSSIATVSGKRWAPCTSPPTATHPPITYLVSIHQLTRSAPLPKPPRLQEPASQAQSHSLPTNGTLLDWHLQQWQQGAAQIMHRMHRARSCLPVPAKRPRAHACAWATRASERRAFLTC